MSDISNWYPAAANNNAASPDGWPEGMNPAGVNNSAREVMAAIVRQNISMQCRNWSVFGASATYYFMNSYHDGTRWYYICRGNDDAGRILYDYHSKRTIPTYSGFNSGTIGDGFTFAVATSVASREFNDVAYNGSNTYVVVGANTGTSAAVAYSGASLSALSSRTVASTVRFNAVAWSGTKFVAVGDPTGGAAVIENSTDGTTWVAKTSGTANNLYSAASDGAGTVIAVGKTGTIIRSTDNGDTWSTDTSGVVVDLKKVCYDGTYYWAVGSSNIILRSTGAGTWSSVGPSSGTIGGVSYTAVGYSSSLKTVMATDGLTLCWSYDGGSTWSYSAIEGTSTTGGAATFLRYADGQWRMSEASGGYPGLIVASLSL